MSKTVSKNIKFKYLVDHYENTHKLIESQIKNRDRNFYYILIVLGVMAFRFFSPQTSTSILNEFFKKQFGFETVVSVNYLSSLVWFVLLAISLRYFQIVINLEKLFKYIHALEKEISNVYKTKAFTREGESYLNNYPKFSDWLHFVYRYIFPTLFSVSIVIKIISEWNITDIKPQSLYLNTVISVLLIISTTLYWYSLKMVNSDESHPKSNE